MDKLKQYVAFAVIGCLAVLAAGWVFLISPKRSEAADLRTQAAGQVSTNAQLATQLAFLKAQAKDLPKQQARLAAVAARIPDNPALPALIRALTRAGTAAGIELVTITPGTPLAATPAAGTTAIPPAAGVAAASTAAASAGQLSAIPLTLSVAGGYFQVEQFVASLENLPRSMRLTGLTLAPGANPLKPKTGTIAALDDGKALITTINAQAFMAANRTAATAVTLPGAAVAGTGVTPVAPVGPAN